MTLDPKATMLQTFQTMRNLETSNMRYKATIDLFAAACASGDIAEQTKLRDDLHSLLDAQLDMMSSIGNTIQACYKEAGL